MKMIQQLTDYDQLKSFLLIIRQNHFTEFADRYVKNISVYNKSFDFDLSREEAGLLFGNQLEIILSELIEEESLEDYMKKSAARLSTSDKRQNFFLSIKLISKLLIEFAEEFSATITDQLDLIKKITSVFTEIEISLLQLFRNYIETLNEKKLTENIVKNSIDGVLVYDRQLKIAEFNPALEKMFGKKKSDVIGKEITEVLPFLNETGEKRFYEQVLKGLSLMVPEMSYKVDETGKKGYYSANYSPVSTEEGTVTGGLVVIHEITKRKFAEEKLKREKQFSESLINNSIDGLLAFDNSLNCTAWNPQMELITGIPRRDVVKRSVSEIFHSNLNFNSDNLSKVLKGEILFYENFQFTNSQEQFELFIIPVYTPDKEITGGLVIAHNITERNRAEDALRELSESLKHTVEGIARINSEGRFISSNKALCRILGISQDQINRSSLLDIIHEDDLELFIHSLEKSKHDCSASMEVKTSGAKIRNCYLEITIVPYQDKFGHHKGHHLFFKDITERKNVENRLKKSEALLIEAQELAKLGSWEYCPSTGEMSWSDEMFRIFGLKPKEIKPDLKTFYSLLPQDAKEVISNTWYRIFKTIKPVNFEHRIVLPGNKVRFAFGEAKPVINIKGEIIKISGYIQDITERKEAEKVLKEAYEELKKAEENLVKINARLENNVKQRTEELWKKNDELREKNDELLRINSDLDNFVYTASHDLRSPMSNIEGLINTLSDELKQVDNQDYNLLIEMINTSINKFKTTIKDLTEITKIQKNLNEDVALISVSELLDEVIYDNKHLFEQTGATLETDLQISEIRFSRKNLRSILYNLISNAVKYRSTERNAHVAVSFTRDEKFVIIKVKDNGLGIDLHQKDKMFRMFKRMHTHVEGTGIGLYIVKRIIENTGGKIEVDSEVGQGTEFKVYLKAASF
jgi:PAS domain S-box-containing protein